MKTALKGFVLAICLPMAFLIGSVSNLYHEHPGMFYIVGVLAIIYALEKFIQAFCIREIAYRNRLNMQERIEHNRVVFERGDF